MLAFMNRVDGRLKQIETQVNKIDEVKSSLVNITRQVSSLEITVKELKGILSTSCVIFSYPNIYPAFVPFGRYFTSIPLYL
jgi:hypothetical protein